MRCKPGNLSFWKRVCYKCDAEWCRLLWRWPSAARALSQLFVLLFHTPTHTHNLVNKQVFFIRDGMKFPDMVHALKPNPKSHIQEGWRIADFFSHHPEAMHMVS